MIDSEVTGVLDRLVSRIEQALGGELIGLYLYGSLVTGDFDDDISDIDLVAVTASEIGDEGFEALDRMHGDVLAEHPRWADRVDIVYVSATALRAFGARPRRIAVISPGEPFHRVEADGGWLMNWYLVREHGRTLFGPPPATFIRPIAKEEFVETVRGYTRYVAQSVEQVRARKSQAYAILTLCRALYAHERGEHVSKHRAAAWAAGEMPRWSPLIQEALRWRRAWRDEGVDHAATLAETRRFVRCVIQRIVAG